MEGEGCKVVFLLDKELDKEKAQWHDGFAVVVY